MKVGIACDMLSIARSGEGHLNVEGYLRCQPQVIGMRRSVYRKSQKSRKSSAKESKQHKANQSN